MKYFNSIGAYAVAAFATTTFDRCFTALVFKFYAIGYAVLLKYVYEKVRKEIQPVLSCK